jgi:hypothetical protein
VPPDAYRLLFNHPGFWQYLKDIKVERGRTTELDIELTIGGGAPSLSPLSEVIVNSEHQGIGATILASYGSRSGTLWPQKNTSSARPTAALATVPVSTGKLTLTVQHPAYRTRTVRLDVGFGNYSDGKLEIQLRRR